jgi:hypothetical protein
MYASDRQGTHKARTGNGSARKYGFVRAAVPHPRMQPGAVRGRRNRNVYECMTPCCTTLSLRIDHLGRFILDQMCDVIDQPALAAAVKADRDADDPTRAIRTAIADDERRPSAGCRRSTTTRPRTPSTAGGTGCPHAWTTTAASWASCLPASRPHNGRRATRPAAGPRRHLEAHNPRRGHPAHHRRPDAQRHGVLPHPTPDRDRRRVRRPLDLHRATVLAARVHVKWLH